ncbi:MAG: PEP-CTERM sorting domain-containing protein [Planctomycetota bacterium]
MNSFSISGTLDDSATENDLLLSGSLTSLQVTRTTTKDAAVFKFDAIVDRSADGGILADTFGDTIQLTIGIANLPDPLSNFSFTPATANATRPVPEPASLFMFSGLLGCMVRFRKKNRRGSVLS